MARTVAEGGRRNGEIMSGVDVQWRDILVIGSLRNVHRHLDHDCTLYPLVDCTITRLKMCFPGLVLVGEEGRLRRIRVWRQEASGGDGSGSASHFEPILPLVDECMMYLDAVAPPTPDSRGPVLSRTCVFCLAHFAPASRFSTTWSGFGS